MTTFGDLIFWGCVALALWYVPRYLWKVYGGADAVKRLWLRYSNMSSTSAGETFVSAPSAVQTDDKQIADRPMMPVPTREEIFDIFRVLRAAGVNREMLRGPWNAAGLKLDNNLWTQAAPPPEEPISITPIAGRPTNAEFRDPELTYQPPPR